MMKFCWQHTEVLAHVMTLFTDNYGSQAPHRNNCSSCCVITDLQMLQMGLFWEKALIQTPSVSVSFVELLLSHCIGDANKQTPPAHPNPPQLTKPRKVCDLLGQKSSTGSASPLLPWTPACWDPFRSLNASCSLLSPSLTMCFFLSLGKCSLPSLWYIFRCQNKHCFVGEVIFNSVSYVLQALRSFLYSKQQVNIYAWVGIFDSCPSSLLVNNITCS